MTSLFLNMLSYLKPFHCPCCDNNFSNKDSVRLHAVPRFPLILTCGHTVCESCIRNQAKSTNTAVCTICKTVTNLSNGEQSVSQLPPDLHVLGVLSANMKQSLPSLKMKMVPTSLPKQTQIKEITTVICEDCCHTQAVWRCDKCEQNFCDSCFDHIHSRVKSMRKHQGKKICAEKYNTMVQEGCKEHKRTIEFFCEDDNSLACSYCVGVGSHKGHAVMTLSDKNESCAAILENVLQEVQVLQKRFRYAEHKINETIPLERIDISGLIKQVHDHFHILHALLQLREADLISYLEEISNTNTTSLEKMRTEISVYEKDLSCVMRDAEAVMKNPSLSVCATDIIKKLEECKTLPCFFTPISAKTDWTIGIELDLDSTLEEILSKHGRITADIKPKYCLKTSSEMPEDSPDIMNENLSFAGDTESVISNIDTFSEDSLSTPLIHSEHLKSTSSYTKPDFAALQQERVIISHIKNPTCFFAQKCSEARKMKNLSDTINKYCRSKLAYNDVPQWSEIEKGEVYLVKYSGDNRWYRGRVLELYEQDTKIIEDSSVLMNDGKGDKIKNKEERIKVFYMDYGNSEIVPRSKLRNIQTQFLRMPGLARQCCLWDILPNDYDSKKITWNEEATKTFAKFVGKRPVIMQIMEERNNILYVDLSQSASDDISNDVPVSVRDALVFLEFGCFPSGNTSIRQKNLRQFMPPEQLLVNININAIISHVDSPSLFYVQQMATARYLSELIFEMQHTYNDDLNTLLNGIYVPFVGMICAAQFRVDKQWYRAQVLNLPGGSMVEVRYVDFGNTEVIHYKSLRKLFDKFCKLNIQAIPCTLADVVCKEGNAWPKETTQWLAKKGSKKQLKLRAFGIEAGDKFAKVALYDIEDNFEICLNTLMVKEGLAASSGPLSKVGKTPIEVSVKISSPIPVAPVAPTPQIPKPEPPPVEKKVEVIKRKSEPSKQLKIRVSYIENPGFFYIRPDDTEEELTALMKDLQMDYEDFEGDIKEVSEGQACAAYSEDKKTWYRATVLSKISEDKVQVRFADYGFMEELPKKNLRNLHEKYYKIQSFVVRCHLSGIIPAGGSEQWSHMSCEAFQQLVSPYDILYLVSKGTADENKSLPSDLLVEELIRGGALEPTEFVTHSITAQLIEKGVALPIRKNKKMPTNSKASISSPNSDTNSTNSTQSIPELIEKPKPPQKPKFQWKPSVPPTQKKFLGTITNIGDDGCIHLHIVNRGSSIVTTIKNALQCKYENCPYEFLRLPPAIGEACMAKFVDKLWYRAEVLATYIDKVKVLFIDYGNCEMVALTEIRTDIIMIDYPRQCLECRLPNIKPARGEEWGTRILDFLHGTLVDQTWDIELLGDPGENNILPAKISSDGIDVSNLLLDMNVAVPIKTLETESMNLTISSKLKESGADVFQNATKLPEEGYFPVCVTQLFEPNIVCLQWLETSDPRFSYEEDRNEELREFLHLIKDLRDRAESFPKVESPKPGMACCAKYGLDDNWYRCEITDIVGDEAKVLYVDYGNSEVIPFDRLRKLSNEFLKFPVQVHVCKLHGLKPPGDDWDSEVIVSMDKAISSSGKDTFAQVVVTGKIPQVHLYLKSDEGEYDMAYNQLIEDGLILIEKPSS